MPIFLHTFHYFTASRLGRRPKRLKEVGEQSRSHSTNVHIAPYPTSLQEIHRYKMAELQKLLQANGTFKSELMQVSFWWIIIVLFL